VAAAGTRLQIALPSENSRQASQPALKVCLVVDTLGPDAGTEKLVAGIASALDPEIIETHICCFETSTRLMSLPASVRSTVFPLRSINSLAGIRQLWRFRKYLQRSGIAVVHSFMNKSAIFSVLASLGTECRTVITSRLNCGY